MRNNEDSVRAAKRDLRTHRKAMEAADDWTAYVRAANRAISAARRLGRLETVATLAPAEAPR